MVKQDLPETILEIVLMILGIVGIIAMLVVAGIGISTVMAESDGGFQKLNTDGYFNQFSGLDSEVIMDMDSAYKGMITLLIGMYMNRELDNYVIDNKAIVVAYVASDDKMNGLYFVIRNKRTSLYHWCYLDLVFGDVYILTDEEYITKPLDTFELVDGTFHDYVKVSSDDIALAMELIKDY